MLKEDAYAWAAGELRCSVAAVKAVASVEGGNEGFNVDGTPKMLFEAHWFSQLTNHEYDASHPNISSRRWNKLLYIGGVGEHARLEEASKLNRFAALQSASWGMFQILGVNYADCGYDTLQAFINDMYKGESGQLKAFVGFIKSKDLAEAMRDLNWNRFALVYNGPGYKTNDYDGKLARAYARFIH